MFSLYQSHLPQLLEKVRSQQFRRSKCITAGSYTVRGGCSSFFLLDCCVWWLTLPQTDTQSFVIVHFHSQMKCGTRYALSPSPFSPLPLPPLLLLPSLLLPPPPVLAHMALHNYYLTKQHLSHHQQMEGENLLTSWGFDLNFFRIWIVSLLPSLKSRSISHAAFRMVLCILEAIPR